MHFWCLKEWHSQEEIERTDNNHSVKNNNSSHAVSKRKNLSPSFDLHKTRIIPQECSRQNLILKHNAVFSRSMHFYKSIIESM